MCCSCQRLAAKQLPDVVAARGEHVALCCLVKAAGPTGHAKACAARVNLHENVRHVGDQVLADASALPSNKT